MKNEYLNRTFQEVENYVETIEKYALIGMMGHVLTHGFNSSLSYLYNQIQDLPDKYNNIKESFDINIGFIQGILNTMYISDFRNVIEIKDIKKFLDNYLKNNSFEFVFEDKWSFYGYKSSFYAILTELISNAKKYGDGKIRLSFLNNGSVIVENNGSFPKNPTKIF